MSGRRGGGDRPPQGCPRHLGRGDPGRPAEGGFRDARETGELSIGAYHTRPSAPTNLTLPQAIVLNGPIACGDAPVRPGDVVVGDGDGCIVIPAHLAEVIPAHLAAASEMTVYANFVAERVAAGRLDPRPLSGD